MRSDCRKPIIGKEKRKVIEGCVRYVSNQALRIVAHHVYEHLVPAGASRCSGWIKLLKQPETGRYWESQIFPDATGGEPQSLLPVTSKDILRFYGCGPPREEPMTIESTLVEKDGGMVPDQAGVIAEHIVTNHLLEVNAKQGEGPVKIYRDPTDGTYWEVTGVRPDTYVSGSVLRMTRLSAEQAAEIPTGD